MEQVAEQSVQVESQPTLQSAQMEPEYTPIPEETAPVAAPEPVETAPEIDYKEALRQERERANEATRRAEFVEKIILSNQQPEPEAEMEFDPNFIPDNQTVEKLVEKKLSPVLNQLREQQLLNQELAVKSQHPDFNEAFEYYKKTVQEDPDLHKIVMSSKNPALRAYQLGKAHPDYMKQYASTAASAVVQKINNNVSAPPTLNNVNGATAPNKPNYATMSRAEFLAIADKIEKGY